MQIKGKIKEIGNTESYGNNNFKKRNLVIVEDLEKYPQTLPVDFIQDKCSLLDSLSIGQMVTVSVNLRSNLYNGKYYVSIQGWKIEIEPFSNIKESKSDSIEKESIIPTEDIGSIEGVDDLPF